MKHEAAFRVLILASCLSGCAPARSFTAVDPLRFDSDVEYIEVGSLVAASENIRVPLGPGRSYWFNASDGSRWASDVPTVPAFTKVIILREGVGLVNAGTSRLVLRHVSGPRHEKTGWYGRVIEERPGSRGRTEVTTEDGRRFEVTSRSRSGTLPLPFDVLVSEDLTRIFVLENGAELMIVR